MKPRGHIPSGLWLMLLGAVIVCGCGKGTGTVSGFVTYQGKPVPVGSVAFFGPNNQVVNAPLDEWGYYRITKVPVGLVKIAIMTPPPPKNMNSRGSGRKVKNVKAIDPGVNVSKPIEPVYIPLHYADPEQSGLTCTVSAGAPLTHNIELK
jgi:hypothetical protein